MVTTRTNQYTQHEVVGEDGTPVTVTGAGGSGTAHLDDNMEPIVDDVPVAGAGRGRGSGGGRGRGRGPTPTQMVIGEAQVQQLLGGLHRPDDFSKMTKNFTLYGGKRYDGLGGAIKAVTWLEGCEEAFSKMEISAIQKREMATQMLDGAALHWWRAIRAGLDLLTFGWNEFLLRFREKFIPYSERKDRKSVV